MKKNVFLYIVIAVLAVALAGLGALNVRSLDKLASLQSKVNELQKSVQEVSDSAAPRQTSWMPSTRMTLLLPAPLLPQAYSLILRIPEKLQVRPHPLTVRTALLLRKRELFLLPVEAALLQIILIPAWTIF